MSRRSFSYFSLFYIFFSFIIFLLSLFKLLYTKRQNVYKFYRITYTLIFSYLMYYKVLRICIGGRFSEDCFYCFSQQITSAVAKASLIAYYLIQKAPEIL